MTKTKSQRIRAKQTNHKQETKSKPFCIENSSNLVPALRKENEIEKWIFIRDGDVRNIFNNRKEAVKYFKELLKQTLKDFDLQDYNDEYDYPIEIPQMSFKPIKYRSSDLSLL